MTLINEIIGTFISAIVLGSLYSIMSMGLTLSWGTLKIFNFTHGIAVVFCAYVAWYTLLPNHPYASPGFSYPGLGLGYAVALPLVLAMGLLLGAIIEKVAIEPIAFKPDIDVKAIVSTLSVGIIIQNVLLIIFGARWKQIPPLLEGVLEIGSINISYQKMIILVTSLAILVFTHFFLKKTKSGMAMRAVAQDREASLIVGIDVKKIFLYVIALSVALASLAGVLLGSLFFITPTMGGDPLFKSFVVIVLGGLGSIKGTIVSAYILGMVEAFTALFLGMFWLLPIGFLIMMIVLLLRPSGIFGIPERQ